MFLRKLFSRQDRWLDQQRTDFRDIDAAKADGPDALPSEYERQISLVLRRWGIPESCASIEIIQVGEAPGGRQVFAALVRIHAWERRPALRLLLGLPLLERKVRKAIRAHWVSELSHFAGVWLHASERLTEGAADTDLRHLIASITHPRPSSWSELRGHSSRPSPLR